MDAYWYLVRTKFVLQPLLQQGHQYDFFSSPSRDFWAALCRYRFDPRCGWSQPQAQSYHKSRWAHGCCDCPSLVVNGNIFNCDQLHLNVLFNRYMVVLFLKDDFVSWVSIAAACLILKLAVINTYCVTSVIMKENQWYRTSSEGEQLLLKIAHYGSMLDVRIGNGVRSVMPCWQVGTTS